MLTQFQSLPPPLSAKVDGVEVKEIDLNFATRKGDAAITDSDEQITSKRTRGPLLWPALTATNFLANRRNPCPQFNLTDSSNRREDFEPRTNGNVNLKRVHNVENNGFEYSDSMYSRYALKRHRGIHELPLSVAVMPEAKFFHQVGNG